MKICSKCEIEKHEAEFSARSNRPCGLKACCKSCDKMYAASDKGRLSILTGVRKHRNTPKGQATYKRYMQSDKGRLAFRQGARRRREKKLGLDPVLSNEEIASIYLRFGNQCFRCGAVENLALDHHRPLSRGYGLTFANAVLLCKSCNSQKHNKMPEEFYTQEELNRLEFL